MRGSDEDCVNSLFRRASFNAGLASAVELTWTTETLVDKAIQVVDTHFVEASVAVL